LISVAQKQKVVLYLQAPQMLLDSGLPAQLSGKAEKVF
jgi:hypothetical protein